MSDEEFKEVWEKSISLVTNGSSIAMRIARLGFDAALAKLEELKANMGVPEATVAQLCERAVDRSDTVNTLLALLDMNFDRPTSELLDEVKKLKAQKEGAYKERNQCVAQIARMAVKLGYKAGLGLHSEEDWDWDEGWRTIVFIDLPTGQVSWHIHDSEVPLFNFLPRYRGKWDGHTTEEKYNRLRKFL